MTIKIISTSKKKTNTRVPDAQCPWAVDVQFGPLR
jgi:hypothetical protein